MTLNAHIPSGDNATRLIAELRERIESEIVKRWQAAERFEQVILESIAHKPKFGKTLDDIERQAIEKALDENGGDKPATIKQLGISRASFYERCKRWGIALALCLCASVVHAAQVTLGVQMAISAVPSGTQTLTTTSAETVAAGSIPIKYAMLKWQTGMSNFVVKVGASREAWTNQFTVATNQFRLTNGLHYGICGVFTIPGVITNATCAPVYWPSNRIDRIIVQTSTNLLFWADAFTWQTNYNKPQEYLRLRSELIRWE